MSNVSPKVSVSVLAAAVVTVVVWLASYAGVEIPEVVQGAIITIIVGLVGYFVTDPRRV
jgi:hypothetical protein